MKTNNGDPETEPQQQGRDQPLKGPQKQSLVRETIITLPADKLINRSKERLQKKEKIVSRSFELPTHRKMIVKMGPKVCVWQSLLPEQNNFRFKWGGKEKIKKEIRWKSVIHKKHILNMSSKLYKTIATVGTSGGGVGDK